MLKKEDLYPGKVLNPAEIEEIIANQQDPDSPTLVVIMDEDDRYDENGNYLWNEYRNP